MSLSLSLGRVGQEKVFGNVLDRKLAFLDIKTWIKKNRKIGIFPEGLVHGFGQNYEISLFFFLGKIRQEKVFGNVRKNFFISSF